MYPGKWKKTSLSWRIFLWKQGGQPWTTKKCPPKKCHLNSAPINPIKTNMYSRLSILHLTEAVAQQTAKLRPSPWRCKAARDASGVSGRWATGPAVARWRTGAMKGWKKMWNSWDGMRCWFFLVNMTNRSKRLPFMMFPQLWTWDLRSLFWLVEFSKKGPKDDRTFPFLWSKSPEAELGSWH